MNERERIDAIEARVNAATGGEWVWKPFRNSLQLFEELRTKEGGTVLTTVYGSENVGDVMMVAYPDRDLIAAAPADIRYLLARISELEAENTALRTNEGNAIRAYQQRDKWIWKLEEKLNEYHTALTPFAAVGAQVAARPAYPPAQTIMRVGAASFTVADLQAAAAVVGVAAEAVTGDSVGTGISEIMGDAK